MTDIIIPEAKHGLFCQQGVFKKVLVPVRTLSISCLKNRATSWTTLWFPEGCIGVRSIAGKTDEKTDILPPGSYVANIYKLEKIDIVDMRVLTKELKPQELQSKNTVSITVHSILVYEIQDAYKAHCKV